MATLIALIERYGLLLAFANVLLEQVGLPVPAYPVLIVTAALAFEHGESVSALLALAIVAALIADSLWYLAGMRVGPRALRLLCAVSLSPDSCVKQTRNVYARWGVFALLVAKFVPGFASVATALAGETRTRFSLFLLFDALGALLWAGVAIAIGVLFHDAIADVLDLLAYLGRSSLLLIAALLVGFVAYKAWQRQRFLREIRMARIAPDELAHEIASGASPLILDVRPIAHRLRDGWIPGSTHVETAAEVTEVASEVVVYCSCPNEASAAQLARALRSRGFARVRPLAGGLDAWIASGRAIERVDIETPIAA